MNNLTLKAKLLTLLAVSAFALILVGAIGWVGQAKLSESIDEIGKNRLPSVFGLEVLSNSIININSVDRRVAFLENDYKVQNEFANVLTRKAELLKAAERGWKIYEPLPQTKEEEGVWNQFTKEWEDWKAADAKVSETILALSRNTS